MDVRNQSYCPHFTLSYFSANLDKLSLTCILKILFVNDRSVTICILNYI